MTDVQQSDDIEASPHGGENLEVMAEARNYNRFLCDLVRRYSNDADNVVDFGAGIATFSGCLGLPMRDVHCVETESASRDAIVRKGFNAYSDISELPPGSISYAFSLNVLEHIEDDARAIDDLFGVLEPGGRLFVYVPAFNVLYTSMDSHVGHRRRYRLRGLVDLIETAGFAVEKSAYTDALGYFATLALKLIDKREPAPLNPKLVRFYYRALFPLSRLMSVPLARILGKNVFVVARKPDQVQ